MNTSIPEALIKTIGDNSLDTQSFLEVHESLEQITSLRINPFKYISNFDDQQVVPWNAEGKYLPVRPSFIADPYFHAGCYYVQEASSMFLTHALRHTAGLAENLKVLDLCAAPGGKSTLLASSISKKSLLVSNEIIKTRVPVLADNLTKWGVANSVVTNNDPREFGTKIKGYFDVVVIDAPCSGSGMFRKDPEAINHWSENNVELCSQRQRRILADVYPALKEGGILIYSTCSYSRKENEDICDWLTEKFDLESMKIELKPEWNIVETQSRNKCYGYRFYPNNLQGEGFFTACFKKSEVTSSPTIRFTKGEKNIPPAKSVIENWIAGDFGLIESIEGFHVIDKEHEADINFLKLNLYLKKAGVLAGKLNKNTLIPDHELALSLILSPSAKRFNLTLSESLHFLRKDEIKIDTCYTGWAVICFDNFALGLAKILPNRINNYYPKELRILKEF